MKEIIYVVIAMFIGFVSLAIYTVTGDASVNQNRLKKTIACYTVETFSNAIPFVAKRLVKLINGRKR